MKLNFTPAAGVLFMLPGIFTVALLAAAGSTTRSRVVRTTLAGEHLSGTSRTFVKYDPRQKYYLCSEKDGMGRLQEVRLQLCPDRSHVGLQEGGPDDSQIKLTHLPRLYNGTGINIGDNPQRVRRKIAAVPDVDDYNRRTKTRVYTYRALARLEVEGHKVYWDYTATYTFHRDKLWSITYEIVEPDKTRKY